jgi:phosphate transport system permease protein
MPKPPTVQNQAKRLDRLMAWIISLGGMLIIASVLGILFFIAREAFPLLRPAKSQGLGSLQRQVSGGLFIEESGRAALALDTAEGLSVCTLPDGVPLQGDGGGPALPWTLHAKISNSGTVAVLGQDGRLGFGTLKWEKGEGSESDPVRWAPRLAWETQFPAGTPLKALLHGRTVETAGLGGGSSLKLLALNPAGDLIWAEQPVESPDPARWHPVPLPPNSTPSVAAWTPGGSQLFVGTREGLLLLLDSPAGSDPSLTASVDFGEGICALGFLLGQNTLLVGGEKGARSAFQILRREGRADLQRFHAFESLPGPVLGFSTSLRDKRFLSWSAGAVVVDHLTTEKRLFHQSGTGFQHATLSPRGDFILASNAQGRLEFWHLDAPHPEISLRTLLGKTHYESYDKPEWVWQSTGGTDDFEPKMSLVPLLFGTLKGTFFAMLFALPLAILGAIYTSQFASPRLRNTIKPMVEIMAALPSVVLGFLAGLVMAPLFERAAIQVFLLPFMTVLVAILLFPFWLKLPRRFHGTWSRGWEVLWLVPVLLLGVAAAMALAPAFERAFLGGDFRAWLLQGHGITYDQRNSIVVGFAMGFAVIPIIFTISEDALSSVPRSLTSASLACGASPWQTAWRVVLPTASPGIFSSVMVGFGRAIGETMIVLMATGNTPVMDWSPFNGMRTLAANIAVETPEAPQHGTLYRVLFLTALLLFLLTFVLNTIAELVRQQLRKRYESY